MIVATAGHVDHGKTSLVYQLTGTNTDKLAQEKQRGLTIELGYAFSETSSGELIGFIDVPGHSRFINNMIAGVSGIDIGMLVVAADDGVMPQTQEHIEILKLLGLENFVVVISKVDLVDKPRLNELEKQLAKLLPEVPIRLVSNKTGEGIAQLKTLLHESIINVGNESNAAHISHISAGYETLFRMYVDRAFTVKGAGLVVTGTSLAGGVAIGDTLHLHSPDVDAPIQVRVREVRSQGQVVTHGKAGQRCALNLAGKITPEQACRGSFLLANTTALASLRLDSRCWTVDSQYRFKHLGKVKVHIGTRRISAVTYFLQGKQANDSAVHKEKKSEQSGQLLQLILENDVIAFAGDRFILRSDDEKKTIGGGLVLDPVAPQKGKYREHRARQLAALELSSRLDTLQQLLFEDQDNISLSWLSRIWNMSNQEIEELLSKLDADKIVKVRHEQGIFIISKTRWLFFHSVLIDALSDWHSRKPMEHGLDPSVLQSKLQDDIPRSMFRSVLDDCLASGEILYKDQLVHRLGHKATVSHQVQREWQSLVTIISQQGLQIPLRSELMQQMSINKQQLERLVRPSIKQGGLFEIGEKRLALPATLLELAERVQQHINNNGSISVIEAKQAFGLGRGVTIEILEFLDVIGYTARRDGERQIADLSALNTLRQI